MTLTRTSMEHTSEDDQENSESTIIADGTALQEYRHMAVVAKLERLVELMQHPEQGVSFRAQKAFLTSIPAAVAGPDLINWLKVYLKAEEQNEANHIASLLAIYGYVYSIGEPTGYHTLSVHMDNAALYRFQPPFYWLSVSGKPDNVDYAIYLMKRLIRSKQKSGLEDYEQTALGKLQKILSDRWQFIVLQAEEELKLSRERKKNDRLVLDMQEEAFWRVHRPPIGYLNSVDHPVLRNYTLSQIHAKLNRNRHKRQKSHQTLQTSVGSKSIENIVHFCKNNKQFDWFLHEPLQESQNGNNNTNQHIQQTLNQGQQRSVLNVSVSEISEKENNKVNIISADGNIGITILSPWLSEDPAVFQIYQGISEYGLTPKQVKMWSVSFDNLLRDPAGRECFKQFLQKEFSSENLRFWLAVQNYKFGSVSQVKSTMTSIFEEFLGPDATSEINIDSKTMTITQKGMTNLTRFTFEDAQEHIYLLMKKDSYQRYLRSEDYKTLIQTATDRHTSKKKTPIFAAFSKRGAQVNNPSNNNLNPGDPGPSSRGLRTVSSAPRSPELNSVSAEPYSVAPWEAPETSVSENTVAPWEDQC